MYKNTCWGRDTGRFSNGSLHPPEVAFVGSIYVIKPGLFQLTVHYISESKAYYINLHLTKNNGQIYNC